MSNGKNLPPVPDATPIEEVDIAVAEAAVPISEHPLIGALGELSDFTDQEPLYAATGAVIATGLFMQDTKTLRAGTRMLAAHLLATAIRGVVKKMVDRTRPDAAARDGHYRLGSGRHHERDDNSFPSGHTAGALAVAMAFTREYPRHSSLALGAAGASGAAQVMRCSHFPTDVIAGAAVGLLSEAAIDRLIRWAERV